MRSLIPATVKTLRYRRVLSMAAGKAVVCLSCLAAHAATDAGRHALERADRFLDREIVARDVVSVMHFGSKFEGYKFRQASQVRENGQIVPGEFALVYRYYWGDKGMTDVVFFFDAKGNLTDLKEDWTNRVGGLHQSTESVDEALQLNALKFFGHRQCVVGGQLSCAVDEPTFHHEYGAVETNRT